MRNKKTLMPITMKKIFKIKILKTLQKNKKYYKKR